MTDSLFTSESLMGLPTWGLPTSIRGRLVSDLGSRVFHTCHHRRGFLSDIRRATQCPESDCLRRSSTESHKYTRLSQSPQYRMSAASVASKSVHCFRHTKLRCWQPITRSPSTSPSNRQSAVPSCQTSVFASTTRSTKPRRVGGRAALRFYRDTTTHVWRSQLVTCHSLFDCDSVRTLGLSVCEPASARVSNTRAGRCSAI